MSGTILILTVLYVLVNASSKNGSLGTHSFFFFIFNASTTFIRKFELHPLKMGASMYKMVMLSCVCNLIYRRKVYNFCHGSIGLFFAQGAACKYGIEPNTVGS